MKLILLKSGHERVAVREEERAAVELALALLLAMEADAIATPSTPARRGAVDDNDVGGMFGALVERGKARAWRSPTDPCPGKASWGWSWLNEGKDVELSPVDAPDRSCPWGDWLWSWVGGIDPGVGTKCGGALEGTVKGWLEFASIAVAKELALRPLRRAPVASRKG